MLKMFLTSVLNLFRKPATHLYPFEPYEPFEDYRGRIVWNEEKCTFCMRCEMVCPPGAIKIMIMEDDTKRWLWNPVQCIYCGECVRNCPFGALTQENQYSPPLDKSNKRDWSEIEREAERLKLLWRERLRKKSQAKKSS